MSEPRSGEYRSDGLFGGIDHTDHIDQIELRWKEGQDFGPIAFSGDTERGRNVWERRLSAIGAVEDAYGEPAPRWSCVYLEYGDVAAFLWRTSDSRALRISQDRGERHGLVARALVGPAAVLTPRLAIALSASPPPSWLIPPPGQVKQDAQLARVPLDQLRKTVRDTEIDLSRRARDATKLERLIATVLAAPR